MTKEEFVSKLSKFKQDYNSESDLFRIFGPLVNFDKKGFRKMLYDLVEEGALVVSDRGKYALPEKSGLVKGILECNPKGFGFVRPLDRSVEDIFVHERDYGGAVHGDTVLVKIERRQNFRGRGQRRNTEEKNKNGEIVKIISRRISNIVGLFRLTAAGNIVIPDDQRFADQVFIDSQKTMGATNNNKVVVKIVAFPSRITMARGEIIEILGDVNDVGVDTLSIIRAYGLYEEFSPEVEAEAKKIALEPTEADKRGRVDFTNDLVITIDGEDARDFDDAISLRRDEKGREVLSVHIADVSHYVRRGSLIDDEAFARATSVYFPDHVLPMLPVSLSNGVCSLNPGVLRFTLSVVMTLDERANVVDYKIVNGIIKSRNRMTYTDVTKILAGDPEKTREFSHLVTMLKDMEKLSQRMIARLERFGEIDFNMPEVQIDMDEKNQIKEIRRKPRTSSERLIEQFMVATNEAVAKHLRHSDLPCVYRIHETPTPERMKAFNDFVTGLSLPYTIPEVDPKPLDVQKVLNGVQNTDIYNIVGTLLLRSMQKARYDISPVGHFGLALKDYCHFTSPIRRYPDLMVHRIAKAAIAKHMDMRELDILTELAGPAAEQSSYRERLADEVEREVDNLKKAEYMSKRIGEEFEGIVSGMTDNGIFVQLDNTIEGFVSRESLPADNYIYDERKLMFAGARNIFHVGERLKVKVRSADLVLRRVDFFFTEKVEKASKKNKT